MVKRRKGRGSVVSTRYVVHDACLCTSVFSLGCHGSKLFLKTRFNLLEVLNSLTGLCQLLLQFSYLCLKLALLFLKFLATLTGWKRRGRCYRVEEERGMERGGSKRIGI